jgi:hypothetical protein
MKISICLSSEAEASLISYADSAPITNGKVSHSVDRSTSPGTVIVNLEYNNAGKNIKLKKRQKPLRNS